MAEVLVVIDVGNSRVKWGLFEDGELQATASHPTTNPESAHQILNDWRANDRHLCVVVASVNPTATDKVLAAIRQALRQETRIFRIERAEQVPIQVDVDNPEQVGVDRLLNALAVRSRKPPKKMAVAVDCGTAITVDLITADGVFAGGAILPGMSLGARALAHFTARLPEVQVHQAPDPVGKNTFDAIRAGLFWGSVGAINELVRKMTEAAPEPPVVFITGGEAPLLAGQLERPAVLVADLTLHGLKDLYELSLRQVEPSGS